MEKDGAVDAVVNEMMKDEWEAAIELLWESAYGSKENWLCV